jgi:signal peptidase I
MTDTTRDAPADEGGKSFASEMVETLKTILGGLAIALVLRVLLFQPFTIPSDSMEPGLWTGDYIVVSKWDYGWSRWSLPLGLPSFHGRILEHPATRGEVVVFHLPRDPSQVWIKRVIGVPGDEVQVRDGTVFVNGREIVRTPIGVIEDPGQPGLMVTRYRETTARGAPYVTFDEGRREGDDTRVYRVPDGDF